jgi:hypothetical protein
LENSVEFPKRFKISQVQWLTPMILATWEAEMGRIAVQGQPRQIVHKIPTQPIARGGDRHHPSDDRKHKWEDAGPSQSR